MSNDFWLGCTWTLACILAGVLITLIFTAVLSDREDPGPGPLDKEFPWYPPDPDLKVWLEENTITDPFEVNLLPDDRRSE